MTEGIGWHFPSTGGGGEDGWNHTGIAHFLGARMGSLARETIQNSLDAHDGGEKPVHVSFEIRSLEVNRGCDPFGRDELRQALTACRERAAQDEDQRAEGELAAALALLETGQVSCLRISDENTTGLTDRNWKALVKMQGLSVKQPGNDALGSHGIGKYAPFAVSPLRTVFYWTSFQEDGKAVEKLQGKSVLMTHDGPHGPTQGTGFQWAQEPVPGAATPRPHPGLLSGARQDRSTDRRHGPVHPRFHWGGGRGGGGAGRGGWWGGCSPR